MLRLAFFFYRRPGVPAALQLFRLGGAAYQERRHWDSKCHLVRGSPGSAGALRVPLAQQQGVRILCPVFRATRASKKLYLPRSAFLLRLSWSPTYLGLFFCCALKNPAPRLGEKNATQPRKLLPVWGKNSGAR